MTTPARDKIKQALEALDKLRQCAYLGQSNPETATFQLADDYKSIIKAALDAMTVEGEALKRLDHAPHVWLTVQSDGKLKVGTIEYGENEKYYSESTVVDLLYTLQASAPPAAEGVEVAWRAIESAPRDKSVIVYCNGLVGEAIDKREYTVTPVFPDGQTYWWWANTDSEYAEEIKPTHWLPLPQPPKIIADKGGERG